MDNQTEVAARKVVDAMVEASDLFTTFDVTTLLRTKGHNVQHYGTDGVRAFVNNLWDQGDPVLVGYARNLHVIGHGTNVFVYHPFGCDLNDYDPDKFVNEDSKQTILDLPPQVAGDDNIIDDDDDDGKVGVDKRGRLCVRAALLRQLLVGPGDPVFVNVKLKGVIKPDFANPTHVADPAAMVTDPIYCALLIDKDNCLRISNGLLRRMFGRPTPDRYELTFGHDSNGGFIEIA